MKILPTNLLVLSMSMAMLMTTTVMTTIAHAAEKEPEHMDMMQGEKHPAMRGYGKMQGYAPPKEHREKRTTSSYGGKMHGHALRKEHKEMHVDVMQ